VTHKKRILICSSEGTAYYLRWKTDKMKKNQSPRNLQGKGGVELLIDRVTRREKWEMKAAKRGTRNQRPRIKYPLGAP
jgi:hypothetical protein